MNQNKNNNGNTSHSSLSTGLGWAIAMSLGATLGVLFAPKEGAETQKDIMDKANELAKKFNKSRADIQKIIQHIFGEVSEELEKNYLELQGIILADLDELQGKVELTQKQYDVMVTEAIQKFSKEKKWSEKVLKNLKENFIEAWENIKKRP